MIRINSDFFHSLNNDSFNNARTLILNVFSGVVPTDQEIKGWLTNTPRVGYDINAMNVQLTGESKIRQGYIKYGTDFRPIRKADGIDMRLASRPEEFNVLGEDALGFFIAIYADASGISDLLEDGIANILIVGTVGDIGSGADLEVPGGALSSTTTYKADDLVFNFS